LAAWAASEMTYIVSGGALNSTQPTNVSVCVSLTVCLSVYLSVTVHISVCIDMHAESIKHFLLSVDVDVCLYVCMYIRIFDVKYLGL